MAGNDAKNDHLLENGTSLQFALKVPSFFSNFVHSQYFMSAITLPFSASLSTTMSTENMSTEDYATEDDARCQGNDEQLFTSGDTTLA